MKAKTRSSKKPGLRAKLALLAGSLLVCFLGLLAAEGLCRLVCDTPYLGSSRNLFVADAYGQSKGNARNVEAVSFGTKIFTDRYGFRVPPGGTEEKPAGSPALLILGDSVGFGAGVEEHETFAGRLRGDLPGTRVYNSSVVGYNAHDYKAIIEHFLPAHEEVRGVVMVFCLNDVAAVSARNIDAALKGRDTVAKVREMPVVRQVNEYLRSRSKLFLTLKNVLTDPQARYWTLDAKRYEVDAGELAPNVQPIADIASALEQRGLPFVVIVAPYEYQLRDGVTGADRPQRVLAELFTAAGIDFVDAMPRFRRAAENPRALYLAGDPMHLAEPGHRVVAEMIVEIVDRWRSLNAWPGERP